MQMRGKAAKQFRNYGELLYQEGLRKEEEKKKLIEKKQLEDEENERKSVTAKPQISKLAQQIKKNNKKVWERLWDDNSKFHLNELRHESMESMLMECTFRPQINRSTHDNEDNSLDHTSRFNQLFWDAENRRRRQAEYMQWYPEGSTFQPAINKQWQSHNRGGQTSDGSVFDRLLQYASKMTERKQRWQQSQSKLVDPATGQKFFRPQTGRRPQHERNADSLPIGDFLYQLKFVLDQKKQSLAKMDLQKAKELANCQYVSHKSLELVQHLRERSLQQLFDYLDADKDGYVEISTIDTKQLPNEVVGVIEDAKKLVPFSKKQLCFEEFVALMMDVQKRKKRGVQLIWKPCKKHIQQEKFQFQFKMDHRSRSLASGRRRFGNSRQWYKLILSDKERREAKIEAMRKEKEHQELAQCTFRPSIHERSTTKLNHGTSIHKNLSPESTVVEKEQQEMHGFIFQETSVQNSESRTAVDVVSPLKLLQSLKRMVSKSGENLEEISSSKENESDFQYSGLYLT